MREYHRLTAGPVLVIDFSAVFGLEGRHGEAPLPMLSFPMRNTRNRMSLDRIQRSTAIGPAEGQTRWRRPGTTKPKLA
jgi:hypothetical protein